MTDRRTFLKLAGVGGVAAVAGAGTAVGALGGEIGYDPEPSLGVDRVVRPTC